MVAVRVTVAPSIFFRVPSAAMAPAGVHSQLIVVPFAPLVARVRFFVIDAALSPEA